VWRCRVRAGGSWPLLPAHLLRHTAPAPPPIPPHRSRPTAPATPLPPHRSLLISGHGWRAQVIAAVHYLHNINVIHRDIKPENLLFVETGDELNVKPADV
jgi:serine/threonine protein kinase